MPASLFRIERIQLSGQDVEEYRISLNPQLDLEDGYLRTIATNLIREQPDNREVAIQRVIDILSVEMGSIINSICRSELNMLFDRTGVLDNTATEHRPDPRVSVPPPRPLSEEDIEMARANLSNREYAQGFRLEAGLYGNTEFQRIVERQQRAATQAAYAELPSGYLGIFNRSFTGDKEHKKKEKASKAILLKKIGRKKYKQLTKRGYFEETGKNGLFRFHLDKSGGVTFIQTIQCGSKKTRQLEWSLCIQSSNSNLPKHDVILSRWMAWKADEDEFLNTANFRHVETADETLDPPQRTVNVVVGGNRFGASIGGMLGNSIFGNIFGTDR